MGRMTALALACLLLLAACGDDADEVEAGAGDGGSSGAVTFDDLVGKTFASTSVTGHDLVADTTVNLTFIDGRLSALAGCNTQNGDAAIVDGKLSVGPLASTMMGCPDDLMAQDQWLAGFLEDGPEVDLDGDVLTLTSGDQVLELTEQS